MRDWGLAPQLSHYGRAVFSASREVSAYRVCKVRNFLSLTEIFAYAFTGNGLDVSGDDC